MTLLASLENQELWEHWSPGGLASLGGAACSAQTPTSLTRLGPLGCRDSGNEAGMCTAQCRLPRVLTEADPVTTNHTLCSGAARADLNRDGERHAAHTGGPRDRDHDG